MLAKLRAFAEVEEWADRVGSPMYEGTHNILGARSLMLDVDRLAGRALA